MQIHPEGVFHDSNRAERGHQLPHCLVRGFDEGRNHQINPLAFLPPTCRPPCGSCDSLILPYLIDDKLRIISDVKPLNPEFIGDA
jgi:hypothetical protein